jgi:hypothetical protein
VLRHAFVTADAGVPLRDVQIAARHADPRTTTRYDRPPATSTGTPSPSLAPTSPTPASAFALSLSFGERGIGTYARSTGAVSPELSPAYLDIRALSGSDHYPGRTVDSVILSR